MSEFKNLSLMPQLLSNLEAAGYTTPTPIQAQSIPILLKGHDLLGIAQTGTGKTAAFSLPILQHLLSKPTRLNANEPRVLVLSPTRELASQINENIMTYSKGLRVKSAVIFGGVGQGAQVTALRGGLDILVATPGRLLDLMNQGHAHLNSVEIFVLDEADRMLDMGFINDIKKIVAKLPTEKQTLFFSATMPKDIAVLAERILKNPKKVEVTPESTTVERINQKIVFCKKAEKYQLLKKVLHTESVELTLVFTRTKHGADKIVKYLEAFKITSAALHGNKSQSAREKALSDFKLGKIKVLVATDIAARGIDVNDVTHVVNYDLPMEAESYVHRIGRTARAGKDGDAISFCDETERDLLRKIEKTINMRLPYETFHGDPSEIMPNLKKERFVDPRRANNPPRAKKDNRPLGPRKDRPKNPQESTTTKVGFRFRKK